MQEAFPYVLLAVVIVGAIVGLITFAGSGKAYDQIGRGGLFEEDAPKETKGVGGSAYDMAEAREMLEAANRRRVAKGRPTVDVDAELARLTVTTNMDPQLMAEIREHVEARNRRRIRRGHEPLDVEAEVARQVRELGGG